MHIKEKKYSVPALEKTLIIMETLIGANQPMGISELAAAIQYPKSSVFLILSTLEEFNYLEKTSDGKYAMTLMLYHQGLKILNQMDVRSIAKPVMEELSQQLGYTVHLARLVNGKAVYIEKVEGPSFVQFSTQIGQSWDLHVSGVGKAIAAYLPDNVLDEIIERYGLPPSTQHSITDAVQFKSFLSTVKDLGYAIEDEEGEQGIRCIAAPIIDHSGNVIASLSVTAVRVDLPSQRFAEVGGIVKEKAMRISNKLGHLPKDRQAEV